MTSKELDTIFFLRRELQRQQERLEELRAIQIRGVNYSKTSTRSKGGHSDVVANAALEIYEQEQVVEAIEINILKYEQNMLEWFKTIDDSRLRIIIYSRYFMGMSWKEIMIELIDSCDMDSNRIYLKRELVKYLDGKEDTTGHGKK